MYPFTREETEAAIAKLAEMYPACFFVPHTKDAHW
jgi:hypothetical protein